MTQSVHEYRVRSDRALRDHLLGEPSVKQALGKLSHITSGQGFTMRHGLLGGAVRLTQDMAPGIMRQLAHAREVLQFATPVEIYVRQDSLFNACIGQSPGGPALVVLSSRLIECFDYPEIAFVLGHELAHLVFQHLELPMPHVALVHDFAGPIVSRPTALKLFQWCRVAEVSADRAGLLCCQDLDAAGRAFFKLASGLSSTDKVTPDLTAFKAQVEALAMAPALQRKRKHGPERYDSFVTHPFNPCRVRALIAFANSCLYAPGNNSAMNEHELEDLVQCELSRFEPSYLEEDSPSAALLRKFLYHAAIVVANANQEASAGELAALAALLGSEHLPETPDSDTAKRELETCLLEINADIPKFDLGHIVQHLTIVASGDGQVCDREEAELIRIANRLGVDGLVVEQALAALTAPLD